MTVTRDEWDEQLGRWRWPDVENLIVYALGEGRVRVVDEFDGVTWQVLKEEVNIDTGVPQIFVAAARAYFKAHEPKPWLEAKPGEVWALTYEGVEQAWGIGFDGSPKLRFIFACGDSRISVADAEITAGRRIWPEAADV